MKANNTDTIQEAVDQIAIRQDGQSPVVPTEEKPQIITLGSIDEHSSISVDQNGDGVDNVDDQLAIVGYGEYDGHLVVGYGPEGNNQADFVIIDVDDESKPTPDDILITDEGEIAILGDIEPKDIQYEDTFNDYYDDEDAEDLVSFQDPFITDI